MSYDNNSPSHTSPVYSPQSFGSGSSVPSSAGSSSSSVNNWGRAWEDDDASSTTTTTTLGSSLSRSPVMLGGGGGMSPAIRTPVISPQRTVNASNTPLKTATTATADGYVAVNQTGRSLTTPNAENANMANNKEFELTPLSDSTSNGHEQSPNDNYNYSQESYPTYGFHGSSNDEMVGDDMRIIDMSPLNTDASSFGQEQGHDVLAVEYNPDEQCLCRICLDYTKRSEVIAPCKCSGSSKWVHRICLDQWRSTSDTAFTQCSVCLSKYKIKRIVSRAELYDKCSWRYWKFRLLVLRDFLLGMIGVQSIIIALGYLVWACDSRKHKLLNLFGAAKIPFDFYYLCGLFSFCFWIGLAFFFTLTCCEPRDNSSYSTSYSNTYVFIYMPMPGGGGSSGSGNGGCCSCCNDCNGCHDLIVCGGQCVKSCEHSACEGGNCNLPSGDGDGGAVFVCIGTVILICILVIAATGLVISVIGGFMFVTSTLERHVGILYRRQIVTALQVQDIELSSSDDLGSTKNPLKEEIESVYLSRDIDRGSDAVFR